MNVCCFCFKKKEEEEDSIKKKKKEEKMVIHIVEVFDESTKKIAKEVASKFPGVTEVREVEGEGQLEVRGEFSISELTKVLKKIEEPVETNKMVPDGVTEPEVKIRQQDEGKRPINIQKASKPLNFGASSSNGIRSQENRLTWEQVKDAGAGAAEQVKVAAEQVKVIGAGAAKQAKDIGAEAFNLLPNSIKLYCRKKTPRKEHMAVVKYWKEEEMSQEKEEEKRKKQENNSGGTSMVAGITGSLLNAVSAVTTASRRALGTGEPSTSAPTQRTGEPSTLRQTQRPGQPVHQSNTNFQHKRETRPVEKKGKNGR